MSWFDHMHPEWQVALQEKMIDVAEIEKSLANSEYQPASSEVMRVFRSPLSAIKVAIFGQDPYPTPGHAMGLAFSVPNNIVKLPPTLRNILKEWSQDCSLPMPNNGDLVLWEKQGVALINRVLTVPNGQSNGHKEIGWVGFTDAVARILGTRRVVAILWGKQAQEVSHHFDKGWKVESAHPSPLSAYRGFFQSRPFTRANEILISHGIEEVDWRLT